MERFWAKVDRSNESGCWLWTGAKIPGGYGQIWLNGRMHNAHRVAFLLIFGWLPPVVMHKCDNPPCCKPDHLLAGDVMENIRDRDMKGRQAKHERQGSAKLTLKAVSEIRVSEKSNKALGKLFGVSSAAIGYARRGETWK